MVHRREVGGQEVVFGNQGDLLSNAMTWFDHETGSVWSQPSGSAVMGPRKGEELELLPSTLTTWEEWQLAFPDTLALDAETRRNQFDTRQYVAVVALNDDHVAVDAGILGASPWVSTRVDGRDIVVVDVDGVWAAYVMELDGEALNLEREGRELVDQKTGNTWDVLRGNSTTGGAPLDRLAVFSSFVEDYERLYPSE